MPSGRATPTAFVPLPPDATRRSPTPRSRWYRATGASAGRAIPASTLATETTGTTNESLTFEAPTISMTVPATVDYLFDGVKFNGWYTMLRGPLE